MNKRIGGRIKIDGQSMGILRAEKTINKSHILLTELTPEEAGDRFDFATWWVLVNGPGGLRTIGFIRPPQERRARETYADLSIPHVLGAFLEGVDS